MSDEKPEHDKSEYDPDAFLEYKGLSEIQRLILSVFQQTANMSLAARVAGVSSSIHRGWLKKSPEFRAAYETCRPSIAAAIEETHVYGLINGFSEKTYERNDAGEMVLIREKIKQDPAAQQRYLAKAKPEVFGDKVEVDSSLEGVSPEEMVKAMSATVPIVEEDDSDT